jgi:hypothetical protein
MKLEYILYWSKKGEYGLERIRRAKIRKDKRKNKRRNKRTFQCEIGYGDCEMRGYCNGDC